MNLLLEPIGGISGDLFLGAMADLGVSLTPLTQLLEEQMLTGFAIEVERTEEHAIRGTRVTVRVTGADANAHAHRSWADIRRWLERLPAEVTTRALAIFSRLARAEAKIHGVAEEKVEFHELGAVDSIVDIVGAAWALEQLGNPRVISRAPPLGSGLIQSQHGVLPIPAPATLEVLAGLPTLLEGKGELTTPTGAAILAACASFDLPASFSAEKVGYGIGHARFADRPNVLRASLGTVVTALNHGQIGGDGRAGSTGIPALAGIGGDGRTGSTVVPGAPTPAPAADDIYVLETHLDDLSPQLMAHLAERLMAAGALDVGLSPLLMKKGRPGQRLTVVCRAGDRKPLTELIFRESTTLGVRAYPVERDELERRHIEVETPYGRIRIKLGLLRGEVVNAAPEYDDCLAAAEQHGVPLKEVMFAAMAAFRR